jgi:protein-S-isoprenylcysteine O-methyltransferase Ste14
MMGARVVFALFALFAVANVAGAVDATAGAVREPGLHAWLVTGYWLLKLAVASAFAYFVAVREPARRPARDPLAFAACAGAIASVVALRPPGPEAPIAPLLAGEVLTLAGGVWLLVSVLALGRCFGVLPEARGLVTRGPYRLVRHPVYLGELAALLGLVLGALGPWNLVCLAVAFAAQRVRMSLEERALTREFPEYGSYAARTPRLIPWAARTRALSPSTVPAPELGAR